LQKRSSIMAMGGCLILQIRSSNMAMGSCLILQKRSSNMAMGGCLILQKRSSNMAVGGCWSMHTLVATLPKKGKRVQGWRYDPRKVQSFNANTCMHVVIIGSARGNHRNLRVICSMQKDSNSQASDCDAVLHICTSSCLLNGP
jgi:hypothetical protein